MSLGYWLGGDPADDSHLPDWVYDYEVCEVCERADTRIQDYPFAEYGIDVCDCVECSECYALKDMHEHFNESADVCDACIDACEGE
jgi:hypothetical protein